MTVTSSIETPATLSFCVSFGISNPLGLRQNANNDGLSSINYCLFDAKFTICDSHSFICRWCRCSYVKFWWGIPLADCKLPGIFSELTIYVVTIITGKWWKWRCSLRITLLLVYNIMIRINVRAAMNRDPVYTTIVMDCMRLFQGWLRSATSTELSSAAHKCWFVCWVL